MFLLFVIYILHRQLLEETAPRMMGVTKNSCVELTVTNIGSEIIAVDIPVHPQKPELGSRVVRRFHKVLVENEDIVLVKEGEEVTLLRWGNFVIDKISKDATGRVVSAEGEQK
jgi:hypothetical protein